jgi:hypothetical protein
VSKIQLFENQPVRFIWDEENEKYWFSVVDIVAVLTDNDYQGGRKYWKVLKGRLLAEGNQLVSNCYQLKMKAPNGKMRLTDVADTEQVLRIIQSIPSKKAESFKLWLAKVGNERIKSIEVRKALTDEWDKSGVQIGEEYAALTDLMTRTWSGMTTREYKKHKDLKKENLRGNMTNTELVLNIMLAEVATTDISVERQPVGFAESAQAEKEGASVAKTAREQLEARTGKPAVSKFNAKNLGQISLGETADKKEGKDDE